MCEALGTVVWELSCLTTGDVVVDNSLDVELTDLTRHLAPLNPYLRGVH